MTDTNVTRGLVRLRVALRDLDLAEADFLTAVGDLQPDETAWRQTWRRLVETREDMRTMIDTIEARGTEDG